MIQPYMFKRIICGASLLLALSGHAMNLFVTSLLDDNSVGTLRTTIANATSGDTILFSVMGTINLDPANGELVVDKSVTIDGEDHIIVDGSNAISVCFHITGATASDSLITKITIQNFKNSTNNGEAYGVLIDDGANGCSVNNCVVMHITSGVGEDARSAGICSSSTVAHTGELANNKISHISSTDNLVGGTGDVYGIFVDEALGQLNNATTCSYNTISLILSGQSGSQSGRVTGILVGENFYGSCNNNRVFDMHSGVSDDESGPVRGVIIDGLFGYCTRNNIINIASGNSVQGSGEVIGIEVNEGNYSVVHNVIEYLRTGDANESGSSKGIGIEGINSATVAYNVIDNLITGNGVQASGSIVGIECEDRITGNCNNNTVTNLKTGNAIQLSGNVWGIELEVGIEGDCNNNVIGALFSGDAIEQGRAIGIEFDAGFDLDSLQRIDCNQISNLKGGNGINAGILLTRGTSYRISSNSISNIHAEQNDSVAYGVLLGSTDQNDSVKNSVVSFNVISNITAKNGASFGVSIENSESRGNDILSNSIFDIDEKAINIIDNGVLTDACVTLTSVQCADGCKFIINGWVIPDPSLNNPGLFLLQFFVSPDNNPSEIKTLIGSHTHDYSQGANFTAKFSLTTKAQFGQFITATATALLDGSQENLNTSEVSNAIPSCEAFSNFCECPQEKPEPLPCPAVSCGEFIL